MTAGSTIDRAADGRWHAALVSLLVLAVFTVFVYWQTASSMVLIWARSETFTHAFLVPPITAWLIWRQRKRLDQASPAPNPWGILLLAFASFAWLLGELAAVNALMQFAFVAMLVLLVPTLLGARVTRVLAFPLAFLFFSVPVGEFAMPQLMVWTADFTVEALRLSGVPVFREGLQFVIPSGNWSVVEACSGVRYLIASVTVGTLFAYLNYQSLRRRILFVGVSILVPVLANWIRAYVIVMLGHLSGNKLATGVDHLIYGWVFFGAVIMLMFMIGARWAEPEIVSPQNSLDAGWVSMEVAAYKPWVMAICFAALVALPQLAMLKMNAGVTADSTGLAAPPAMASGWQADSSPSTLNFTPAFNNPSSEVSATYTKDGLNVGMYLAHYHNQSPNRKLVSSSNVLVASGNPTWSLTRSSRSLADFGGSQEPVRSSELSRLASSSQMSDERLAVWQIYWVSGNLTASDYIAKVYSAVNRLLGRGDNSAVIVVFAIKDKAGAEQGALRSFLSDNYQQLNEILTAAGQPKK